MDGLDVLLWAAGAEPNLPTFEGVRDERILYLLGIDEDALCDLLDYHRLAPRFLHRFQQERPSWCSKRLLVCVETLAREAEERGRRNLAAAREIARATAAQNQLPIFIKGFSTYALTGEKQSLRWSSDLDLLASDLDTLWETLERLGFTGRKYSLQHDAHVFPSGKAVATTGTEKAPRVSGEYTFALMRRGEMASSRKARKER